MLRRRARSTLFPYTTLFRSLQLVLRVQPAQAGRPALGHAARHGTDRKSTRLNSSHLGISYAVFCLKKKRDQTVQYPSAAGLCMQSCFYPEQVLEPSAQL